MKQCTEAGAKKGQVHCHSYTIMHFGAFVKPSK